ncbi:DUF5961 family protein, partial [Phenylobacterium sp.]|uniref:DUF5961 family protein n=1 Tax=Phenylobacterium sp. TaxID=1871053 RepID=UPI002E31724B
MITPAIRSDGATRRFVVHTARETRDQGRVVRAASFHEAALAYAEAWRPIPDANGAIRLSLTDLDSGEQQDATIDVARPGVADLQARRARLELRAAARSEPPPGAERFRVDPVEPLVIAAAKAQPRDYRQLAMNGAALLAVLVVTFLVANRFTRERLTHAPWEQPGAVAEQPGRRLTAATALLRPQVQPSAAQPSGATPAGPVVGRQSGYFAPRQAAGSTTARNIPMDQLAAPSPDVSLAEPLDIPPAEAVGSASPAEAAADPAEAPPEPLVVRRSGEADVLGSRSGPDGPPSDD